ncbi:MAG TPA: PAS domain S-box protein, partial [Methanobacterium sp.]|nr:PAS domain S-box protein [Methanobacterium sp.]
MKKKFLKKDKNFSKSIKNNSTNYLNIFENMVLGVSIFELILNKEEKIVDLQITYVNRRSILNKFKKHEKFTGKGINELFKKDIADFYLNIARKAVSTGKSLRFETYFEQLNKYFLINAFLSGNNSFVILDLDITQKKETEEELRNTLEHLEIEKRQLSAIVENIPVGVIIAEAPSGKFILANKQIAEIWRYPQAASADEFKKYKGFHHDGSPYKPYEWPLSRSIRTGKAVKDEEIQILRGDGTKGWLSVSSVPVNDNGNIIMGIVIDLDITERKKAEENLKKARNNLEGQVKERTAELKKAYGLLKESEEKFRELFNKATDTIVLSEVKENGMPGKFIEINEAASKRLGYNKDEFENMTPLDLFASDNRDELSQITSELQKKGYTSFESISITKYKEEFPVEVNVHVFKLRGRNVALAIARDISERKKVEKALRESVASKSKILDDLRESEGKFRALYDDNPSMYFTVGPDFIVLSVNQFGAELLGYKVPELINQPLSIVFYDKDKEFAVQNLKHTLENHGQVFYWELRKKRKDGSILWVKETARAVKEPEGNVVIYTVCEDITDRKEAEKSLKESEKKFRELFDQATDMLSLTELNDDGTINKYIEINEAGSKRLGYSKAEILDMSPLDIYLDHSS